jgi:hypothetical protein
MKTSLDMAISRRKELLELIAAASNEIAAIDAAVVKEEGIDYSEAAYVDSQHEYLQEHKSEGSTLEELGHTRASQH